MPLVSDTGAKHRHQCHCVRWIPSLFTPTRISLSDPEEKKKTVKILLDYANDVDLLVLPIVELGGLGKTTFVLLVYNDPKIKMHFQFQKCCVSENFYVGNIARSICSSTDKDSENTLQDLQKELSRKRCLLVLDDVWSYGIRMLVQVVQY
jgi:hypothetical protein